MSGERTLYGWSFFVGRKILERLELNYGVEKAEKRMKTILLNLRSELLPDKFRRELINVVIEVTPDVGLPEEVKVERAWRIDEFYRYSTAVLAGLYDALQSWREQKGSSAGKA